MYEIIFIGGGIGVCLLAFCCCIEESNFCCVEDPITTEPKTKSPIHHEL